MKKKIIITALLGLAIAGGIGYYMFNMPKRDIQAAKVDIEITSSQLVNEYLTDKESANDKYLQVEGESKILAITGTIISISKDMNDQQVVLLNSEKEGVGVSCTFTKESNENAQNLKKGDLVSLKGVIRSGAEYDEDLEMYEDVIVEKCDILK